MNKEPDEIDNIMQEIQRYASTYSLAAYDDDGSTFARAVREKDALRKRILDALDRPSVAPVAWMTADGRVSMDATKNCMPKASKVNFNIPLFALDRPSDPITALIEQALECDMGYGPHACPTCGKSDRSSEETK